MDTLHLQVSLWGIFRHIISISIVIRMEAVKGSWAGDNPAEQESGGRHRRQKTLKIDPRKVVDHAICALTGLGA